MFAGGSSVRAAAVGPAGLAGSAGVSSAGGILAGELIVLQYVVTNVRYRQETVWKTVTELTGIQTPQSQIIKKGPAQGMDRF